MKRRMTKIWFVLSVAAILALGFVVVKAAEGDLTKPGEAMRPAKECTMMDMQKCMMKCTANCEKNMKNVSAAMGSLDEAVKAIDAGSMADAKMKIEQAKMMLKDVQNCQKKCMEKMPTCNTSCPISGKKIDRMNLPENLTTMYKGKKIGFCCSSCPPQWEKLTDAEKEAKLEKVIPMIPEKEDQLKNMPEDMKIQKKDSDTM